MWLLSSISLPLLSIIFAIVPSLYGQGRVDMVTPPSDDQQADPGNHIPNTDPNHWLARITELQPRSLPLPYELDESSIILPPGSFLEEDLARPMLGGSPHPWHVWLVGRLQTTDSTVSLVLKFEGPEADYVDIYVMVVYDSAGARMRTELLGVFASAGGRVTTSRARVDDDMNVTRSIDW